MTIPNITYKMPLFGVNKNRVNNTTKKPNNIQILTWYGSNDSNRATIKKRTDHTNTASDVMQTPLSQLNRLTEKANKLRIRA